MIITSILDLDLYKLTVGEVIFTYFRKIKAKYKMKVRNGTEISYQAYAFGMGNFDKEVEELAYLSLTEQEARYLRSLNLFSEAYIQFLMNRPMYGVHFCRESGNQTEPEVSGEWCRVMLYEIFCLAIGNEIYAKHYAFLNDIDFNAVTKAGTARLIKKTSNLINFKNSLNDSLHPLDITEFGTRRRLSKEWQKYVLQYLWDYKLVTGTSNVYLAMKMGIPVRGTFGHEFTMGMQGVSRIQDSQIEAFALWLSHWKGKLKIALDDTFGTDKFLRDFSKDMAEKFDGLRHDSGDWKQWTNERLRMYAGYGIDATKKVLFYSDGLNDYTIQNIHHHVRKNAIPKYGVGTFFTNDTFLRAPQAVMKIVECNGQPVAKLSNNPAKASCTDETYLTYIKHVAKNY